MQNTNEVPNISNFVFLFCTKVVSFQAKTGSEILINFLFFLEIENVSVEEDEGGVWSSFWGGDQHRGAHERQAERPRRGRLQNGRVHRTPGTMDAPPQQRTRVGYG